MCVRLKNRYKNCSGAGCTDSDSFSNFRNMFNANGKVANVKFNIFEKIKSHFLSLSNFHFERNVNCKHVRIYAKLSAARLKTSLSKTALAPVVPDGDFFKLSKHVQ